jgi:nucleoside-diphosphate-sugar epimerase
MIVLVAGAGGRVGELVVALLLARGHEVRGLVRAEKQIGDLEALGATPVMADLRGDVEWVTDRCDAVIFAASARHTADLGAIDAGGAAKLAEAAARSDVRRFVLCSAVGADRPDDREEPIRTFLSAKHQAERRLHDLELPWTVLRFGRLTDAPGTGRIGTALPGAEAVTLSRDDAALTAVEALDRSNLVHRTINVIDGDRHVAEALDAIEPEPLPPSRPSGLAAGQPDNPTSERNRLATDAGPFDPLVDFEGEGEPPPEIVGNDDPAPGIP